MTTKTKFTLLWTGSGFFGACLLLGVVAPFLLWRLGGVDERTSTSAKLIYTFLPMLPFAVAVLCLLLGLLGRLPGTKDK
ncbi:MAG: hypothetical protein ABIR24_04870 [Verrucomicrobiota bacterium]